MHSADNCRLWRDDTSGITSRYKCLTLKKVTLRAICISVQAGIYYPVKPVHVEKAFIYIPVQYRKLPSQTIGCEDRNTTSQHNLRSNIQPFPCPPSRCEYLHLQSSCDRMISSSHNSLMDLIHLMLETVGYYRPSVCSPSSKHRTIGWTFDGWIICNWTLVTNTVFCDTQLVD